MTDVHLITSEGGQISGAIDLTSIYGFSGTDIYAVGSRIGYNPNPPPTYIDSSLIIHYDGSAWRQVDNYGGRTLTALYGKSTSDIWAGGLDNTLYYYNGNGWKEDSIKINLPAGYSLQIGSISSYNSIDYAIANSNDNKGHSIYYLYKKVNDNWAVQDSFYPGQVKFGGILNRSNTGSFYSNGDGGVYKYNGTSWDNIFPNPNIYIDCIWGTSDENIFAVSNGSIATVFHFNGTDWKEINQVNDPQSNYFGVWTDGTEAFVVGHINDGVAQKTIIWHGK